MKGKSLYEVYKGKELKFKGVNNASKGIVCGYHKEQDLLLVIITQGKGWQFKGFNKKEVQVDANIALKNKGNGFSWITEFDIIRKN